MPSILVPKGARDLILNGMNQATAAHQEGIDNNTNRAVATQRSYWQSLAHVSSAKRLWGRLLVAMLFVVPGTCAYAGYLMFDVIDRLNALSVPAEVALSLTYELRAIGFLFFSSVLMLCLVSIYMIFFISVRVFGPQVAIIRFINQMKAGNFAPYRKLRKDDQLKEIWEALQGLAEHLRANGPKNSKTNS